MGVFKFFLTRMLIALFTALFIYPAILLACLVLGFTSSWKSGLLMLLSALLLLFVLKREAAAGRTAARRARSKSSGPAPSRFAGFYDSQPAPPQLSDIYDDIAAQMREQEALMAMLRGQEREGRELEKRPRRSHPPDCGCPACKRTPR